MERFGLTLQHVSPIECGDDESQKKREGYLLHRLEELISAPALQAPVIIVLFAAADAEGAIAPTTAAEEPASTELDLAVIDPRHRLGDQVPVGLRVEVVGPTAGHMYVLEVTVMLARLEQQDTHILVLSQTAGDDAS